MGKFSQLGKTEEDHIKVVAFELGVEEQLGFECCGKLGKGIPCKEKIKRQGTDLKEIAWERVAPSTGKD